MFMNNTTYSFQFAFRNPADAVGTKVCVPGLNTPQTT